jgi:hypothetical protein
MKVRLFLLLLGTASSCLACEVASRQAPVGELFRELECDGKVVASERVRLLASGNVASGVCEYRLRKHTEGLPGCRVGTDPHCGTSEERDFSAFAFADVCDWSEPDRTFQLSSGVTAEELPKLVGAFNAARDLTRTPSGLGWASPMQAFAKASLRDITRVEKEGDKWTVYLRTCSTTDSESRSCSAAAVTFALSPRSLEEIRAYWLD